MIRLAPAACALAAALLAAPPGPARAAPVRDIYSSDSGRIIRQTRVDAAGLDLSRDEDRQALMDRIAAAADAVCQARPPGGPEPYVSPEQIRCRQRAMGESAYRFRNRALWALAVNRIRALGPAW